MSFAELQGKITGEFVTDRSEDLLTSDVFGTLHFLGPHTGMLTWLNSARRVGDSGKLLGEAPVVRTQLEFWPRLDNNREPDLAILCEHDDGQRTLIVVEAKYLSGLSNTEADGEERSGHQLLDQCRGMRSMGTRAMIAKWFPAEGGEAKAAHLLVTADSGLPIQHYDMLRQQAIPMYWLSWCSLAPILQKSEVSIDSCEGRLIEHLARLLRRKALVPYAGFAHLGVAELQGNGRFWKRPAYFRTEAPAELIYRQWRVSSE